MKQITIVSNMLNVRQIELTVLECDNRSVDQFVQDLTDNRDRDQLLKKFLPTNQIQIRISELREEIKFLNRVLAKFRQQEDWANGR